MIVMRYKNMKEKTNIECGDCGHAWFTSSTFKVVNCPSCRKPVKNPQYKPKFKEELEK